MSSALYILPLLFFLIFLTAIVLILICSYKFNENDTANENNSYMDYLVCDTGNDCPSNYACVNNICTHVNQNCDEGCDDELLCINMRCAECADNNDCPSGQGCFNSVCRYPYVHENVPGYTIYPSINREYGYLCSNNKKAKYFVNGIYRCVAGSIGEKCKKNFDCESNLCKNGICVSSGGECEYNCNCPPGKPYCVDGICSKHNKGSQCTNSKDCTLGNPTNINAPYCVNNICTNIPGERNSKCSSNDDCQYPYICKGMRCVSVTKK